MSCFGSAATSPPLTATLSFRCRVGAWFSMTPITCAVARGPSWRGRKPEIRCVQLPQQVDRMHRPLRIGRPRHLQEELAVLRCHLPAGYHDIRAKLAQVPHKEHVGIAARRNLADVPAQPEVLGGVEGGHLDGLKGAKPFADCVAKHPVHVPLRHEGLRVGIIRAEDEVPWIKPGPGHRGKLGGNVVPGRAVAQHHAHSLTDPCNGVFQPGALVVVLRPSRRVSVEWQAQVRGRVVTADDLLRLAGRGHLRVDLVVAVGDAGEVHHLPQADDARPRERLLHVRRPDHRAGGLQARG